MVGFVPLCDRSRLQNAAQSTNGGFLNAVLGPSFFWYFLSAASA